MTPAPLPPTRALLPLEAAAQQAWQLLERRLRLLHGFGLLVYSVRTPALADALKARLAEHLRGQQRRLVVIASPHPEQFAELSLKTLLGVPESADTGAYWLEAHRGAGRALWDAERRELLLRLNERRSILEAEHHAPLILLLPAGGVADMARLAPDLWHIRLQSTELAAALPVVLPDGMDRAVEAIDQPLTPEAEAEVEAALGYWFDQWRRNFDGLSAYELRSDHPRLWDIALWDGGRALDVCLQYGRLDQASMVAQELLSVSRLRAQAESDQPLHLRDVSVSLDKVGAVAQAQGDWTGAEEAYRESLEIRRQLVEWLGSTPEALRDVSVSLEKVGAVAQALGDWMGAQEAYRESLEISRQLVERLGGTPGALRDVSVSLNKVGAVAQAQGDWSGAEEAYRESLEISRQRVERLGGTPEALRDVSVSLNKVGAVAQAQGDWMCAGEAYRESLEIRRQLVERLGGTPEALDDLAISLMRLATVREPHDAARLSEAATIYASLVQRCPQVPQYADRLQGVRDMLAAVATTSDPDVQTDIP
jgi:tetratricopeptide (TPR) repeat protein